eukprot:TRINITY_DN10751_c0_g2_i1.p2 TRINITY_DN10751_c0_g2~~TRINITY_DN10751_c0_g2_i1.p2  ORF type:complete len:416 (+),score=82.05 TRINITY_DN10751_c0_g2_i1:262-1509(+)
MLTFKLGSINCGGLHPGCIASTVAVHIRGNNPRFSLNQLQQQSNSNNNNNSQQKFQFKTQCQTSFSDTGYANVQERPLISYDPRNYLEELRTQDEEIVEREPRLRVKANGRVVAIGDLHGDMEKTENALKIAKLVQFQNNGVPKWIGGDTVVVQVGDVLDRGDREIEILLLLQELDRQARLEGGAVYMLNGNHESLNVCGDFRYVTQGAMIESARYAGCRDGDEFEWTNQIRARVFLFAPGGPIARDLAKNPTILIVNDTLFVHGGLLPQHVTYGLEQLNYEVAAWMRGDLVNGQLSPPPFLAMGDQQSVMWNRTFSREEEGNQDRICHALREVLRMSKVKRMVVGHTPQQQGCNAQCGGMVWRVDVGMSGGVFGAPPSVLEIVRQQNGRSKVNVLEDESFEYEDNDAYNHIEFL